MLSQREIAESLNVSIMTVSRALRNHPDLSSETRERILRKAEEMGYVVRSRAKMPAARRRLALLVFDTEGGHVFESGVQRAIFRSLQRECQKNKAETVIEVVTPGEVPLSVKEKNVDAFGVFGRYEAEDIACLRNLPALAVSSFVTGSSLSRIVAANAAGMREATGHLISLGHRRILCLATADSHTELHRQRVEGYLLAMFERGLEPSVRYIDFDEVPSLRGHLAGTTAIVCSNDGLGLSVLETLPRWGLDVPGRMSLVSFDDLPSSERLGLTTYAPDWEAMGRCAADFLLFRPRDVCGKDLEIVVPGKLVVRSSTGAPSA